MATQREKIKNELDLFKKTLIKYKNAYSADGIIDKEEAAKLKEVQAAINKIEEKLNPKEKEKEREVGETGNIDGKIPEGDNFKGAKEIDVTVVKKITKLFEEGVIDEYGEGISHDDVKQNWVADCFFLSALAAVAKAKPSAIKKLVTGPKKDGSYDVTLYQRGGFLWLDLKPEIVNVHPKTLEKGGLTTVGLGDGELWVLLVERAFAQINGGYDEIWFGNAEKALETITGKEASTKDVDDLNDKELIAFVNKAFKDKRAITTSTFTVDEKSKKAIAAGKVNLYMSHEYYVMSITSSVITLRNPHNNNTPGGKVVNLSLSDYRKYFEHLKSIDS